MRELSKSLLTTNVFLYVHVHTQIILKNPPGLHNFCKLSWMNRLTLECTKLTACIFHGSDSQCKNEYDEKKWNIAFKVVE